MLFLILHKYTFNREYVRHSSYAYYMGPDFPRVWFCSSPTDSLLYPHTRGMHEYMEARGIDHVYREMESVLGMRPANVTVIVTGTASKTIAKRSIEFSR